MNHSETRERPILVAVLLCIIGIVWCIWLHRLFPSPATPNNPSRSDSTQQKCHQVQPVTRTVLLVFAVFLSLSALFYLVRMMLSDESSTVLLVHKGVPIFVLLVLFLLQIMYILHIKRSRDTISTNCSKGREYQYYTLLVFAVVQSCIGVYLLVV